MGAKVCRREGTTYGATVLRPDAKAPRPTRATARFCAEFQWGAGYGACSSSVGMDSSPGAIDTRNIVSVCRTGNSLDRALLREMLGYFIDENQRRMTTSQHAVVKGDREMLRQLAHAMRGSAALVGAGRLHDLAWALEMDAPGTELQLLARAVGKLRVELDAVVDALQRAHPEAWSE